MKTLIEFSPSQWHTQILTSETVGAWEPSFDPQQWKQFKQLHMLLQNVDQQDGNDAQAGNSPPAAISVLVWQPER